MHESGLIEALVECITSLACENGARRVIAIEVSVGGLAGIGALREHFRIMVAGTLADGAELHVRACDDPTSAPLVLDNVELER
jgi:Zn finger protein HypA/HybF involved in hydrogenase expression